MPCFAQEHFDGAGRFGDVIIEAQVGLYVLQDLLITKALRLAW